MVCIPSATMYPQLGLGHYHVLKQVLFLHRDTSHKAGRTINSFMTVHSGFAANEFKFC